MQVLHKNESQKHANASTCIVHEYPLGDTAINGAVAELNGRYPEQERVTNTACKELAYVIKGSGKIIVEDKETVLNQGDMVLIQAGEKYYWKGQMTLFLSCTPAWYPEQQWIPGSLAKLEPQDDKNTTPQQPKMTRSHTFL